MLGGYFAGVEECEGEWKYEWKGGAYIGATKEWWQPFDPGSGAEKRKTEFTYYGMSSHHSQEIYEDSIKQYRASEGTKITVSYKGALDKISQELLGGIRSCCCYIGSNSIKNMSKCGQFCKVNQIHSNKNPIFGV
jgi:GMP reductase